jgi:hypothetical protein
MTGVDVGAVLLLGPPGAGKSLLGRALAERYPSSVHRFLNVGEELRGLRLVEQQQAFPTEAGKAELVAEARRLVQHACRDLRGSSGRPAAGDGDASAGSDSR